MNPSQAQLKAYREEADFDGDGSRGPDMRNSRGHVLVTRFFDPPNAEKAQAADEKEADEEEKKKNAVKARGVVVFLCGIGSSMHRDSEPYVAQAIGKKLGFAWAAFDWETHGLSEGAPRKTVRSYTAFLDDAEAFLNMVTQRYPGAPIFLHGESMGGGMAILLGLRMQAKARSKDKATEASKRFAGCVFEAPAIHNSLAPPSCVIALLRCCCVPLCPLSTPRLGVKVITPDNVWREEAMRKEMWKAKLAAWDGMNFCTGNSLLTMTEEIQARLREVEYPFCCMHGTGDQVIPVSGSEALFREAGTPADDKELVKIADAWHHIFGDPAKEEALNAMLAFLKKQVEKLEEAAEKQKE